MSLIVSLFKPLAYISLPIFILRGISNASPTGRYYVRVGMYLGALATVAAWGAVVGVALSLIGRRYDVNYVVARSFYFVAGHLMDIEIEVEGKEHLATRPVVLMGNHQSMLDILILGKVFPLQASIMAKKEIQWTPLGPFMSLSGALFVDRGNSARAVQSLAAAGEGMKERRTSIWMFPEGTRSSSEESTMRPFKKGGFHLAVQAGIPILPVVAENYWWLYRAGVFGSGKLKVRVLPPIPTSDLTTADVPALAIQVHGQMLQALREISVNIPPRKRSDDTSLPPVVPSVSPVVESQQPSASSSVITTSGIPALSASAGKASAVPTSAASSISDIGGARLRPTTADGSENGGNGTETEDDDGWGLVGRPAASAAPLMD